VVQAATVPSKQYEYLLNNAVLKFKSVHIITTGISVLGVILSYIIAFSTPYRRSAMFGTALVLLSIIVLLINYNSVKASCKKYTKLCPDYKSTLINTNSFHKNLIFSVWVWIISTCLIIAIVLPDKLLSRFATNYRFHILFIVGIVLASVISFIIQFQHKYRA
jgi:hypothetical protein